MQASDTLSSATVAADGTIYFTSVVDETYEQGGPPFSYYLALLAVNSDGSLKWQFPISLSNNNLPSMYTPLAPTPTIAPDGTIYVGGVLALDPCGCSFKYAVDPMYAAQVAWGKALSGDRTLFQSLTSSPPITQIPQPQLVNSIASQLDGILSTAQAGIYTDIAKGPDGFGAVGAVESAGQALTGDKLLLQAYATLGLSSSLQSDDNFHSLLYGGQAIAGGTSLQPGDDSVQTDFGTFSASPIVDTDNQINIEVQTLKSRASALSTSINAILAQVQNDQIPESLDQIDTTLADLIALQSLLEAGALSRCNYAPSPTGAAFDSTGGSGTITIQELDGCSWNVSTGASWLQITSGSSGTGNGTVTFSAASNPSNSPREGVFIIGDTIFHVAQSEGPVQFPAPSLVPTPLQNPTLTPTNAFTPTVTPTQAATNTWPPTNTPTPTNISTPTSVSTVAPTNSATPTPTINPNNCCQQSELACGPAVWSCSTIVPNASCNGSTGACNTFTPTPAVTNTPMRTTTATPLQCTGDCNNDHSVTIDEILLMVHIALGNAPCSECVTATCPITVDLILTAVNNALNGCPAQ
jgi:hypothetical protein